jgi:hypothetical protein
MSFRHNCEYDGCYIKEQTPDWGFLDNSFSGKIRVSDIDGVVEANGHLLILEWKGNGVPATTGQEIMFKNITKINNIIVFLINGDAKNTIATHLKIYSDGGITFDKEISNEVLQSYCTKWELKVRSKKP